MRWLKKLIVNFIAGVLVFLLFGLGYNIFIGKPVTLKHYFIDHHISYMNIALPNNNGVIVKSKELTNQEFDDFIRRFGSYKVFKPFFRKSMIAKNDNNFIYIALKDENRVVEDLFPLTDRGEVNLFRYTFYPYHVTHKDMYNYLLNLLDLN